MCKCRINDVFIPKVIYHAKISVIIASVMKTTELQDMSFKDDSVTSIAHQTSDGDYTDDDQVTMETIIKHGTEENNKKRECMRPGHDTSNIFECIHCPGNKQRDTMQRLATLDEKPNLHVQNVREKCFEILLNEKGEKSLQDNSQVDEDFIKKGENSSKKYESANSERILVNEENTTNDCKAETLLQHHDKNDCSTSKTRETLLVEDGNDKVQSTPSELFNGETTDKLIRREDNVLQNEIGDFTREISESLLQMPIVLPYQQNVLFIKVQDKLFDFFCQFCRKDFSSKSALSEHMLIHSGEQPYTCDICGKKFNKKGNLMRHMNVHGGEKKHSCGICGKGYNHACSLKDHMKRHTGEKPHECHICQKRFAEKCNLKRHVEWHSGLKPHTCNICGKTFYDVGNLSKHGRVHTGERPYECSVCGKRFRYPNTLQRHERIHTGEAPFVCPVCSKAFFSNAELHNHSVIHTGIKRFKCDLCGKSFKRNHHLTQHSKTHTGEKPYSCDVCGGKFVQTSGLRKHMRTFHPAVPTTWQDLPSFPSEDTFSENVDSMMDEKDNLSIKLEILE